MTDLLQVGEREELWDRLEKLICLCKESLPIFVRIYLDLIDYDISLLFWTVSFCFLNWVYLGRIWLLLLILTYLPSSETIDFFLDFWRKKLLDWFPNIWQSSISLVFYLCDSDKQSYTLLIAWASSNRLSSPSLRVFLYLPVRSSTKVSCFCVLRDVSWYIYSYSADLLSITRDPFLRWDGRSFDFMSHLLLSQKVLL